MSIESKRQGLEQGVVPGTPFDQSPAERIVSTLDRLCESWRKGYKDLNRRGRVDDSMFTQGRMQQTEYAISLLLGTTSAAVHYHLMRTGGTL